MRFMVEPDVRTEKFNKSGEKTDDPTLHMHSFNPLHFPRKLNDTPTQPPPPIRRGNRYRSRSNSIRMADNGSEWKDGPCWKKCTVIGLNWSNEMYDNIMALRSTLSSDRTQPNPTKPNETQHMHRKNVHLLRGVCTRRVFRHKTRNFFVFRIFLHSPHPKSVKRIEALWKKKR